MGRAKPAAVPCACGPEGPGLAALYPSTFRDLSLSFRRRGLSLQDAEDLAQETILRTIVHLRRSGQTSDDLGPLIRTIARNLYVQRARRPRLVAWEPLDLADPGPQPLDHIVEIEARVELRNAIDSLAPRHRRVIALSAEGLRPAQIADVLGIKRNAADALLHRARRRLHARIEPDRTAVSGMIGATIGRLRSLVRRNVEALARQSTGALARVAGGLAAIGAIGALSFAVSTHGAGGHASDHVLGGASGSTGLPRLIAKDSSRRSATVSAARRTPEEAPLAIRLRSHSAGAHMHVGDPSSGESLPVGVDIWHERDDEGDRGTTGPLIDEVTEEVCASLEGACE